MLRHVKEYFTAAISQTHVRSPAAVAGFICQRRGSLMFFSPVIAPWIDLSIKAGHLAFEAQALVGLRPDGDRHVPLLAETQRMIPEKVAALTEARALVAKGGVSDRTARKVVGGD